MDNRQFDDLARMVASIGWSRRRIIQHVAQGGLAALLAWRPDESAAKKKRKKKKKKKNSTPSSVTPQPPPGPPCPDCAGKACSASDRCGGTCQSGSCPGGQTCQSGQCVANGCNPACTGNETCQNGSCVCANGTKKCPGDVFDLCHECCLPAFGDASPDCVGNPDGHRCLDLDRNNIYVCACDDKLEVVREDGRCVPCLDASDCDKFQQHHICSPENTCVCDVEHGWAFCDTVAPHPKGCYDLQNGPEHCGSCDNIGCVSPIAFDEHPAPICRNGQCCAVPGGVCFTGGTSIPCCGPGACQFNSEEQLWLCS